MRRAYYDAKICSFLAQDPAAILGKMTESHGFTLTEQQRDAWRTQIMLLQKWLVGISGHVVLEFTIPRLGRRIDCVLLVGGVIFVLEFKVGATDYSASATDQVEDYALDLSYFHSGSRSRSVVPVLVSTQAPDQFRLSDIPVGVAQTVLTNGESLPALVHQATEQQPGLPLDAAEWLNSTYEPTPTIVEAAQALYRGHSVSEISRSDAGASNLTATTDALLRIIHRTERCKEKAICFVTGVPGAGKTLAGLNLVSAWHKSNEPAHAVLLSGNGPLVKVLREALARNHVQMEREAGRAGGLSEARRRVEPFIQNVHHFRDEALRTKAPPVEKVVVFDEAQRAWSREQTSAFMQRKKGVADFDQSEPEFLIRYLDRHPDWAVVVCLVGGGQEIHTGEAGLPEWFDALERRFPEWRVYVSGNLESAEYTRDDLFAGGMANELERVDALHLSVSLRSFRSENVAAFVKALLDCHIEQARQLFRELAEQYPVAITRDLDLAKQWLREHARGTERFGIVASSGGRRLRAHGLDVKSDTDPVHWFLNDKRDVRSSFFLESVATEFAVQGLELDWACVAWDADLRLDGAQWRCSGFQGTKWMRVHNAEARRYLKNTYRVLLTRARQGMVLFVPRGDGADHTRPPAFYDGTYEYLRSLGIPEVK